MIELRTTDNMQHNSLTDEGVIVLKHWPTQCHDLNIIRQMSIELREDIQTIL